MKQVVFLALTFIVEILYNGINIYFMYPYVKYFDYKLFRDFCFLKPEDSDAENPNKNLHVGGSDSTNTGVLGTVQI